MTHSCFKKLVYNVDDDRYTNLNNIECAGTENVKPEMDQTITSVFSQNENIIQNLVLQVKKALNFLNINK